jgi:SAM-dependent methyltransferase
MSLRKIFYSTPTSWRRLLLKLWHAPQDLWNMISGNTHPLVPPKGAIYTGGGDFLAQGNLHLQYLVELSGLQPHHSILDVGSGIGRTAVALTTYLNDQGQYEGFDAVDSGVKWCQDKITSRYPNFKFQFIPLKNDLYNHHVTKAEDFIFPYNDNQFDRCCLMSVFTHMTDKELENYLIQCSRVLKKEGQLLATLFLYDDHLVSLIGDKKHPFGFPVDHGHFRLMDPKVKGANVAYHKPYLLKFIEEKTPFKVINLIPGYWSGQQTKTNRDFQDILVLSKT